ncbi:hypothetical protein [Paraburkholderia bannensis]|uniref:hypothetical protein n=1 Tax=Paraburkholderia bannensis TaxID=765414 RepID=UPI002ABE02F7|nr:hypothetical protein [Paraburkholderia bannensis]
MQRHLLSLLYTVTLVMWLGAVQGAQAQATTTTLSFDGLPNDAQLTTQDQSLGVTASGVYVVNASLTSYTNPFGTNVAYSVIGLMTFTLNPAILGSVQTVSSYVSGNAGTTLSAYDASGNLVGQAALTAAASNQELSATTSGSPIVKVEISGPESAYAVDELIFSSSVPFAKFGASLYLAPKLSAFAASDTFTLGASSTGITPPTQAVTLSIGSLTISLPAGSFVADQAPRKGYVYRGKVNGVDLFVDIYPTSAAQSYGLFILGAGYAFPAGVNSMPVAVTIGANSGSANVTPHYVSLPPTSP